MVVLSIASYYFRKLNDRQFQHNQENIYYYSKGMPKNYEKVFKSHEKTTEQE